MESKYFESFDENGIANEEYAEKFLSYEPEIDNLTNQLEKIQNEKRAYVKKCVEETEKSMIESGMAENVKLSEKNDGGINGYHKGSAERNGGRWRIATVERREV